MNNPEDRRTLPPTVRERAQALVDEPVAVERLGGMSGGRVYRVRGRRGCTIVKRPAREAEIAFYRDVVPLWPPNQRLSPTLLDLVRDDGQWWLVMEDIPHPLPRERWQGDAEVLAALARLHAAELREIPTEASPYRPAWTRDLTERALAALPAPAAAAIAAPLVDIQQAAQPLFARLVPLSGDPNPANWGLRDDGRLVLFDWERFCRGAPALDLAITIPGLGDAAVFCQVAERYLAVASLQPAVGDALAREIAQAKVWSVVEFLAFASAASDRAAQHAAWVADRFVPWLFGLVREMDLG